jgi:hypothetical protein
VLWRSKEEEEEETGDFFADCYFGELKSDEIINEMSTDPRFVALLGYSENVLKIETAKAAQIYERSNVDYKLYNVKISKNAENV